MRIALLAPLYERVPPATYGGTERVIANLADELVRRGHDVTLFATGDSQTRARLVPVCPSPLCREERLTDPQAYHVLQLGLAYARAGEFDLIHSHCDFRALPFAALTRTPTLSTNHNRLDAPENRALLRAYPDALVTVLSESHRQQLIGGRCLGITYNGIAVSEFPFSEQAGDYLAFVGRLSPEKGPLDAIQVAERTGIPLKMAARINPWERDYFERQVRPRLRPPLVEFIGEIGEREKRQFVAGALALLCPLRWPEPFGLVIIEALATGTPVLAYPCGAAPELICDGVNGFLCTSAADMARRAEEVASLIDRHTCRRWVKDRFSVKAMVDRYEEVYRTALGAGGVESVAST